MGKWYISKEVSEEQMQCSVAQTLSGRQGAQSPCFRGPAALVAGGQLLCKCTLEQVGFQPPAKCVCHLSAVVLNLLHGTNPRRCGSRGKISLAGGLQQGCCSRGVAAGVHTIRGAVALQCSPDMGIIIINSSKYLCSHML